jgi:PRTRC genetic system ThiF family protein
MKKILSSQFTCLLNTKVLIIGAGGTGSHVAHRLAMLFAALPEISDPSIHIIDYAPVREANMIRQVHNLKDVGLNKALALAGNLTNAFSVDVQGYSSAHNINHYEYDFIFCCVDSYQYRMDQSRDFSGWYIDCGNAKDYGQVITSRPTISNIFKDFNFPELPKTEPSCTLSEAMDRQSLFINTVIADIAVLHFTKLISKKSTRKIFGYISWVNLDKIIINTQKNTKYVDNWTK